jgi:allantoicase
VDIDTSHFSGNYPPAASIDACKVEGDPDEHTAWDPLIAPTNLRGNSHHYVELNGSSVWTHLRLNIFPDGGVARLRVHGEVVPDWARLTRLGGAIDLAALDGLQGSPASCQAVDR